MVCVAAGQSVVVDQLAATVNGEPITRSDIMWGLALNPQSQAPFDNTTQMATMLNQLIDQRLLLMESLRVGNLAPTELEVNTARAELIKEFPNEASFSSRLAQVGLTSEILTEILRQRLQILKFIDFRFRSFAVVTEAEIQQYYNEILKPKLLAQKILPPEQPSNRERQLIESILIEERISRDIEQFLENARRQADIVTK